MKRSASSTLILAAAASITFGVGTLHGVESFQPSLVSSPPVTSCRSNILTRCNNFQAATGYKTVPPQPRQKALRLNGLSDENGRRGTDMNLLEPGTFPTIEVEEPPQEDIYQQAIGRTLLWVGLAAVFGAGLGLGVGPDTAEEFFAGYLVEQSLSVDNLFVFLLLFEYFRVPLQSQDRVLNWGIYGAVVMRALMIGLGAAALERFHAILLVFAGILVYSSAKTLIPGDEEEDEEDMSENAIVNFSRNLIDSTDEYDGSNFFTIIDGVKKATPLFICMIALEISDVVFAVDSIPAVFGVTSVSFYFVLSCPYSFVHVMCAISAMKNGTLTRTHNIIPLQNPLVVFSSNMFAIMGLRSLYTILSKAASDLKYLEPAVGIVLGFIGSKMIAEYFGFEIPTEAALGVVAFFLSGGVGLSVWEKRQEEAEGV